MPTFIDEQIALVQAALGKNPIDWNAIRGAAISLDVNCPATEAGRDAIYLLKSASRREQVYRAIVAIQHALLDGTPGVDGWPRRY